MMMNPELGRKVAIPVMLTTRILERVDAIAAEAARTRGGEANRSEVIRRMLAESLDREEKGARE